MGEESTTKKKRGRSPVKTEEKEEQATATPNSEERCIKNNGKGWQCKEFRLIGEKFCSHHLVLKRVSVDAEAKPQEEEEEPPKPNYKERCCKNDGKGWSCKEFRLAGEKLCRHHLDLRLNHNSNRKKTQARVSADEKRKADDPSTSRVKEGDEWASEAAEFLKAAMAKLNEKGSKGRISFRRDAKERISETIRRKLAVVKLMVTELEKDLDYLTDLEVEKNDLEEMLA